MRSGIRTSNDLLMPLAAFPSPSATPASRMSSMFVRLAPDTDVTKTVLDSNVGNGNRKVLYESCYVLKAATSAFGGLSHVPGSWTEAV